MNLDWVREYCLSLPYATETVQWEDALVFKVGGKMFAVAALEPRDHWLSFKCMPEGFAELLERPGIVPAPYLARAHWVALKTEGRQSRAEIQQWLQQAYELIFSKLPKKLQANLGATGRAAGKVQKGKLTTPTKR